MCTHIRTCYFFIYSDNSEDLVLCLVGHIRSSVSSSSTWIFKQTLTSRARFWSTVCCPNNSVSTGRKTFFGIFSPLNILSLRPILSRTVLKFWVRLWVRKVFLVKGSEFRGRKRKKNAQNGQFSNYLAPPRKWPAPPELFFIGLFWYFLVMILAAAKLKMLLASYDRHLLSRGHAISV